MNADKNKARNCSKFLWLLLIGVCVACGPTVPPAESGMVLVTALPTLDENAPVALCAAIDLQWNNDWPRTIALLEQLLALDGACGIDHSPQAQLYVAHYNYGVSLAEAGSLAEAITHYQAAQRLDPVRLEAPTALRALGALTPEPLAVCVAEDVTAYHKRLPDYAPASNLPFITITDQTFTADEDVYLVQGVNYYPANAPWRRFLTESALDAVAAELDLIQAAGFNTLRLFLWHEALFQCPGNGAVPRPEGFARLDGILQLAAARDLRVILTLHDLPDLLTHPLYTSPDHTNAQTVFLVERYRDEPAILAWDVRNEGDLDYDPNNNAVAQATREDVLTWLAGITELVRAHDPHHLITAGWFRDEAATIPYVDFVSFHHWDNAITLRLRTASLRQLTDKPILLEEFGYSTFNTEEVQQGQLLNAAIQAAEVDGLAGWLIWSAFDFPLEATCTPPACPSIDSIQHHFGLWRTDYEPKIALGLVRIAMYAAAHPDSTATP